MKWNNPGQESVIDIICNKENKYYIWGAGKTGVDFLDKFKKDLNIIGIIDSNEQLVGQDVEGIPIKKPEDISSFKDVKIIITINTSEYIYEVTQYLRKQGLLENEHFFRYLLVQRILNCYCHNCLYIEQTDLSLTTRCTLRCKDCLLQMPYIENPVEFDWEEIKNRIDLSFKFVDCFGEYHLVGGEPTLSLELVKSIKYLGTEYRERFDTLVVVTNATLEPKEELLNIFKQYQVRVEISDYSYSKAFSAQQKVDLWIQKLEEKSIKYGIRKQESWYCFGRKKQENCCDREIQKCFEYCDCAIKTVSFLKDRVYLCARAAVAEDSGLSQMQEDNSFVLEEPTEENRRKFLEYVCGYTPKGYLEECTKCYTRKFFWDLEVPAAQQLKR